MEKTSDPNYYDATQMHAIADEMERDAQHTVTVKKLAPGQWYGRCSCGQWTGYSTKSADHLRARSLVHIEAEAMDTREQMQREILRAALDHYIWRTPLPDPVPAEYVDMAQEMLWALGAGGSGGRTKRSEASPDLLALLKSVRAYHNGGRMYSLEAIDAAIAKVEGER